MSVVVLQSSTMYANILVWYRSSYQHFDKFICGNEMQKKNIPREESASKSCFLKDV